MNRAGFQPVREWQHKGCRKVNVERASCGSAPAVPGGYQGGESSCWQRDAKAISLRPHTGMPGCRAGPCPCGGCERGTRSLEAFPLSAPGGPGKALPELPGFIFSSVPSLAPAPTSSPHTASPAPTKTRRYISARSNHLGLSQPRTQTDSKPTREGCQPPDNRILGSPTPPPPNAIPECPASPPRPCVGAVAEGAWKRTRRNVPAWGTGVMLGVIRQCWRRGEGLITC